MTEPSTDGVTPDSGPDFGLKTDFYTFAPETLAQELPGFEILREVGKGSMGIVYEARRRSDGRRVALKVLPPSPTLTERALARFLREGEIMARVQHPAIVQVYDHGRQGRLHFFVMEFVDGMTLEERLRVGPLPARTAAELAAAIARALQFAHDRGVVHRDVKPGNLILREDGPVAITDFGLARETGTGSLTESGAIVGTPMYMSPEQVLGDRGVVGTRADVYGLGATLYHLVTGRPPFSGPTAQSVLKAVLEHDPKPPNRLREDLPEPLAAIIWKAMAKEPARRYATALELAEDLERFLRGERVLARLPGALARAWRGVMQRPLPAALALALLLLGTFAYLAWREGRLRRLEAALAEAEWALEKASARDDESLPRGPQVRKDFLGHAVAAASEVIEQDSAFARAWFVRSKAYHRLQRYRDALHDLDMAESRFGHATPEILHFRIDTLQHLDDRESRRRLREDLIQLLAIDEGVLTRCLVTEHLLALVTRVAENQRPEILNAAEAVIAAATTSHPRVAVTRAQLLELRGDLVGAEQVIRQATSDFERSPLVHARAAALLRRLGRSEEGESEAHWARMLDPDIERAESRRTASEPVAPIDWGEIESFLGRLGAVLRAGTEPRR